MEMNNYTTMDLAEMILQEKTNKITPENIRHNVQIFDIVGAYKGDSGAAYSPKRICFSGIGMNTYNTYTMYTDWYYHGKNLDIFDAEHLDVSNATNLCYSFYATQSIDTLRGLTNWDTHNMTSFYNAFYYLRYVPNVNELANWNTSNVRNLGNTFYAMSQLSDISGLANWDVGNVTDMSSTFVSCYSIKDASPISNWNLAKVSYLTSTFSSCSNLMAPPMWDMTNIHTMTGTFSGCTNLTGIETLPNIFSDCVFTSAPFSGMTNFSFANRVTNCDFRDSTLPLVKNVNYINNTVEFISCNFYRPFGNYYSKGDWLKYSEFIGTRCNMAYFLAPYNTSLSPYLNYTGSYNITNCDCQFMFANQQNLNFVQNINLRNCNNTSYMFNYCNNITTLGDNVNIHFASSGQLHLDYMFYSCTKLADVTCIENWTFNDASSSSRYIYTNYMVGMCNKLSDDSIGAIANLLIKFAPNIVSQCMNLSNSNSYSAFGGTNIQINTRLSTEYLNRLYKAGYRGFGTY